jgi:Leucine-rich repeat (LRR) protein
VFISRLDICDIPENIKFCKALVTVDFSGNPLSRYVKLTILQIFRLKALVLSITALNKVKSDRDFIFERL